MKKLVSLFLFCNLILGVIFVNVNASSVLKDTKKTDWYYKDLQYILNDSRQIISGYPDGTFKPNEKLSVEQFITMVVRASGFNPKANKNERWSKPFIDKAIELGYIRGNDFIEIDAPITRGEMARIVVISMENITGLFEYRDANKIISYIGDYDEIGNGFKDACVKAYDAGIITGYPDGTFKPRNVLTRAEATAVIRRLIDMNSRKIINIDGLKPYVYKVNPDIPQELYEYDFRKREWDNWYGTNKWMVDRFGLEMVTEWMNIGKGYVETFYNVDYKKIDKNKFIKEIQWYFMPQIRWIADDGISKPIEEHFIYWVDMIKEKEIQIEMKFITDPSLVYSNGRTLIRGVAIFNIINCNDLKWLSNFTRFGKDVKVGKTYQRIVEIELINMALNEGWEHAIEVISDEYFITSAVEVNK